MQYIQIIEKKLKEKNITAKKMLLDLGYSRNLMNQWKNGNVPSLDKIIGIAAYLDVPVDYLLGNIEVEMEISPQKLPNIKNAIFATPQRLVSLKSGVNISQNERFIIGKYMNCSQEYLYGYEYSECEEDNNIVFNDNEASYLICNILDQCAASEIFKMLQLQISRLIARNLKNKFNITYPMLLEKKHIDSAKLKLIYESDTDMSGYGFNFSDIMRIMDDFKILPPDMFKG